MLINLIPPQYRIAAAIAGVVALVLAGFGAGWAVQGWRLGAKVERLDGALTTCEGNVAAYADAVVSQNESIKAAREEAARAQEAARRELEKARQRSETMDAQIRALRRARGETCEDAEQLIDEALGL